MASTVGKILLLVPITALVFWSLVFWNAFINQELFIRRLSMNDGEITAYGWIVFWLFLLETLLASTSLFLGFVEPRRRFKVLLLGSALIRAMPCLILLTVWTLLALETLLFTSE